MDRPAGIFDREREWGDLVRLAQAEAPSLRLGILYGRRRFGKSFLLRRLVRQVGGLYHLALEQERQPALTHFAARVATLQSPPPPLAFADWDAGIRYVLQSLGSRPGNHVVVLDEYPYLQATSPELDSVIQAIIDDVAGGDLGGDWAGTVSLILCGSAMSVMTDILSGSSPLRGRAILDAPLGPFDYRQAREFWGIEDLTTAFYLHAVMGGVPGYKDLTAASAPPVSPKDLQRWLGENVLNPSHALYREDSYLLREDPRVTRQSLYYSLLNAVASGATSRSKIASRIGKKASDLDHPLNVLLSAGFIRKEADFLSERKPSYLIADPIVRFHELITRRHETMTEERSLEGLWEVAAATLHSQIVGPHFEELARAWTAKYASAETLGGPIGQPHSLQVSDSKAGHRFQVDVVAATRASASRKNKVIQVIGEAKGTNDVRTVSDLVRLEEIRRQLEARGIRFAASMRFLVFSLSGFTRGLIELAHSRSDVELVDLDRLYRGI